MKPSDYPAKPSTPRDHNDKPQIPPGRHRVTVKSVKRWATGYAPGESIPEGEGKLIVDFRDRFGNEITGWYSVGGSPGQVKWLADLCRAVGWPWEVVGDTEGAFHDALVGYDLQIVVKDEEFNGRVTRKVQWTNRLDSTEDRPDPNGGADEQPQDDDIPF